MKYAVPFSQARYMVATFTLFTRLFCLSWCTVAMLIVRVL